MRCHSLDPEGELCRLTQALLSTDSECWGDTELGVACKTCCLPCLPMLFLCVCVFIREFLKDLVKHRVPRKGQSFEAEGLPLANLCSSPELEPPHIGKRALLVLQNTL